MSSTSRGQNLTEEDRRRGGQNGAQPESPSEEAARRGGENSSGQFEEGNEYGVSGYSWHRDRNKILQEFPDLWEAFGDEPPKHPGGEVNEAVEAMLDD